MPGVGGQGWGQEAKPRAGDQWVTATQRMYAFRESFSNVGGN